MVFLMVHMLWKFQKSLTWVGVQQILGGTSSFFFLQQEWRDKPELGVNSLTPIGGFNLNTCNHWESSQLWLNIKEWNQQPGNLQEHTATNGDVSDEHRDLVFPWWLYALNMETWWILQNCHDCHVANNDNPDNPLELGIPHFHPFSREQGKTKRWGQSQVPLKSLNLGGVIAVHQLPIHMLTWYFGGPEMGGPTSAIYWWSWVVQLLDFHGTLSVDPKTIVAAPYTQDSKIRRFWRPPSWSFSSIFRW